VNATSIIWTYAALIIAGGVMGFVKAKSKASLIMSILCAVPLVLVALGKWPILVAQLVAGFLMVFFSTRYASSKKLMPAGLMAGLSILTLGLLLWLAPR